MNSLDLLGFPLTPEFGCIKNLGFRSHKEMLMALMLVISLIGS